MSSILSAIGLSRSVQQEKEGHESVNFQMIGVTVVGFCLSLLIILTENFLQR